MKSFILLFLILFYFSAKAQFHFPTIAELWRNNIKWHVTADNRISYPSKLDTIPLPPVIWKTITSPDKIVSASLMLIKDDGSIIMVDSIWKINIRKENDRVAIIFTDSTRVLYKVVDRMINDSILTIPFTISKKTFDKAQSIKLEIIR